MADATPPPGHGCGLIAERLVVDAPLDCIGLEVPDELVVGYRLDYGEEYCNLPFTGIIGESEANH